jgi:hypothetical protein
VVAGGRLGGGKGDDRLPGDDVSSRPVATSPPARRSRPAATADPADVLGQGAAEEAEFIGERAPDVGLPTRSRLGGRPALSGPRRTSSSPRGVVHILLPDHTRSSPSSSADIDSDARSDPDSGSE